jgi:hypothetical protein
MKSFRRTLLFAILVSTTLLAQSNPVPLVNQPLVPASAAPGSGGFLLTVSGTGFAPTAVLYWNGSERTTIINSSSSLQAIITSQDVARAGTASVTVVNPAPGGASNVVFFPTRTSASTVGFAVRPEFVPGSVVSGDFNNDGILDVAVGQTDSSTFAGSISIYLGRGDGTFSAPVVTSSTVAPLRLVTADINGDGNLDLFVSRPLDDDFSVYTNMFFGNGDGTLTQQAGYVNGTFEAAGDWNGDGKVDLIVGDGELEGGLSVSIVYLGDGKGGFTVSQGEIGNNVAGHPTGNPAIGDFNGDGRLDLGFPGSQLAVALGNGDGTFQDPVYYQPSPGGNAVAAADINGDGKLDLITDGLSVLLGNGDGTFTNFCGVNLGIRPQDIGIGDFNGDGKLDAVISGVDLATGSSQTIQILLGKGDGTFQLPVSFPAGGSLGASQSLAIGDFNGDGRLDLVLGGAISSISTMLLLQDSVNVSPNSLAFGDQGTGTISAPLAVTVTNVGTSTLNIQSISFTGSSNFAETDNCSGGVAAGSSCSIMVTFSPTTKGLKVGRMIVKYQGLGSPAVVALDGTGVNPPTVSLTPPILTFPTQLSGTASLAQTVTLTNTGTLTVNITSIATTGDFAETNNCPSSLLEGYSCQIQVQFKPTGRGADFGKLLVTDNATGSPQGVRLSGTGTVVQLSATGVNFGDQKVGTTSGAIPITLNNEGTGPLSISQISITGTGATDFSQTNDCGTGVAGGGSCTIKVTFAPTATGALSAAVSITDNGGASPQSVLLTGIGD